MTCSQCGKKAVAFYGRGPKTANGTILVSEEKLCYECYCEKYGEDSDAADQVA